MSGFRQPVDFRMLCRVPYLTSTIYFLLALLIGKKYGKIVINIIIIHQPLLPQQESPLSLSHFFLLWDPILGNFHLGGSQEHNALYSTRFCLFGRISTIKELLTAELGLSTNSLEFPIWLDFVPNFSISVHFF